MKTGALNYLVWWGPYGAALLAIAYSVLLKLTARESDGAADSGPRTLPAALAASIALIAAAILAFAGPQEMRLVYAVVFFFAGLFAVVTHICAGWRSRSSLAASSSIIFSSGLALLGMVFLRNHFQDAPVTYLYAGALGVWLVSAVICYGAIAPTHGLRALALSSVVLAAAGAMGGYHYTASPAGSSFAVAIFALALLLAVAVSLFAGIGRGARVWTSVLGGVVLLVLLWWLGAMLGNFVLNDVEGGWCAMVGAAAVLACYLLHVCSVSAGNRLSLLSAAEAGILAVLLTVAATAVSIRWLGGYGVSLAAVGAAASLGLVYVVSDRLTSDPDLACCRAGVAPVIVAAAFASVALVRTFLEATSGYGISVDLFEAYTLPGLALGGTLVLMLGSLRQAASRPVWTILRGLVIVLFAAAVVVAVTYLWRLDAITGLVIGIAAGLFYTLFGALLNPEQDLAPDLVTGVSLFCAALMPVFLEATLNLTRDQKVWVLVCVLIIAALIIIGVSTARIILHARGRTE